MAIPNNAGSIPVAPVGARRSYRDERADIHLKEFIQYLWGIKWAILAVAGTLAVLAGVGAWLTPDKYQASIVVLPVTTTPGASEGGLSSLVSHFGGLASLAGLSLNSNGKRDESIAVLKSEALTEKYIKDNGLLRILYSKHWNADKNRWTYSNPKGIPDVWKATQFFDKKVRVVQTSRANSLVTLTITWTNPYLAAQWANGLVKMTNDYLRDKAIAESERNIAFLTKEAADTNVVGVKEAIYAVLQNEINTEMFARGTEEYALRVIDPAIAPESPSSPKPVLWMSLGFFLGLTLAIFGAFARLAWQKA